MFANLFQLILVQLASNTRVLGFVVFFFLSFYEFSTMFPVCSQLSQLLGGTCGNQCFFLLNYPVNSPIQSQFKPVQGKILPVLAVQGLGACSGGSWKMMPAGSKGASRSSGFRGARGSPRRAGHRSREDVSPWLLMLSPAD